MAEEVKDPALTDDSDTLEEGTLLDYITNGPVKASPVEKVRQRVARALFHQYRISPDDMARDFKIPVKLGTEVSRRKVEIAIFAPGAKHTLDHLRRVVICRPEPKQNKKGVNPLRDHQQASKDLNELREVMASVPSCEYGMWTNGLDQFYLHKRQERMGPSFEPSGYWPMADESFSTLSVLSLARIKDADEDSLKWAFSRCHRFIHGNEGLPKDAAFWQFLYLIFAKMYDEQQNRDTPQFYVLPDEPFEEAGQARVAERVKVLFRKMKEHYSKNGSRRLFLPSDELQLSDKALAFLAAELARFELTRTELDAKGVAYQELAGKNLRGDRGQYFTPRGAVKLAVQILDPQEHERVLDPACGTGGFLVETLSHLKRKWKQQEGKGDAPDSTDDLRTYSERLRAFAERNLFGADFDRYLVRSTSLHVVLDTAAPGNFFHMDSLAFPDGHLEGAAQAVARGLTLDSVDVLMTNPPFGSDIPITDPLILAKFQDGLARKRRREKGKWIPDSGFESAISPEVLFVQRSVEFLRPGGRMGIVLPNGILSNPGDRHIRQWILDHCWVLASVELPVETFIHEADVNILTSLLFLKKKSKEERLATEARDYPVFMAVAERVGYDRRGNVLYKRAPDGEIRTTISVKQESARINGETVTRTLRRLEPLVDDDLPVIAEEYKKFRAAHPEPGLPRREA